MECFYRHTAQVRAKPTSLHRRRTDRIGCEQTGARRHRRSR